MADKKTTSGAEIESEPVVCRRCKHPFANLVIENIKGVKQMRTGSLLITRIEANCLNCGFVLFWNIREKDIQRMTVTYGEVLDLLRRDGLSE